MRPSRFIKSAQKVINSLTTEAMTKPVSVFNLDSERKTSSPVKFVFTSHPVSGNPDLVKNSKNGAFVAKNLWHEGDEFSKAIEQILENYEGEEVSFGSWNYSDCDRHPDQKPGIITLGELRIKLAVIQGLGIETDELVRDQINEAVEKLKADFDLGHEAQGYKVVLAQYAESIELLNQIWASNLEKVNKAWEGSDYRISGSDLEGEKSLTIKETLREIFESPSPDVTRLVIADCEGVQQIESVKELLSSLELQNRLKIIPLFEDRVAEGVVAQIIENHPDIDTIQIAGSDSKRRIGYVGLLKLLTDISLEIDNSKREMTVFAGSGNTHWRAEDLTSLIPREIGAERTVQGQLVFSMADENFAKNFLEEQRENLSSRPFIYEARDAFNLLKKLDKFQQGRSEATQDDAIFKKAPLDLILNNSKFFGSRHKPNKFPANSDSLSERNLLDLTRAIEHAWIYKLTAAVSPEITDLHSIISNDELRQEFLAKKDNPYVIAIVKSASKGMHYCDEKTAIKYYVSDEVCSEHFTRLREVEEFINENFKGIESRAALVQKDLKWYDESPQEFAQSWQQFEDFRMDLAQLVTQDSTRESDLKQKVNSLVHEQYVNHPTQISKKTGRTFSTLVQREALPKTNGTAIALKIQEISDLFEESPAIRTFAPSFSGLEKTTAFQFLGQRDNTKDTVPYLI